MATPHVAGVAALYLQGNTGATPAATVRDAIVNTATADVVTERRHRLAEPAALLAADRTGGAAAAAADRLRHERTPASLSGTGDFDIQPNGTYYQSTVAGTHKGCLTGPAAPTSTSPCTGGTGRPGRGRASARRRRPPRPSPTTGTAGYYYWQVYSYSGSGSYTLTASRP